MGTFFTLLEQLVSPTMPSIVAIQALLGVTLMPVNDSNRVWHFYEGRPVSGPIALIDYREPVTMDSHKAPFLVVELHDATIHIDEFLERYGEVIPKNISVHHPHFIGYTCRVNGNQIGVNANTKNDFVLSVSIDYTEQVIIKKAMTPTCPADSLCLY